MFLKRVRLLFENSIILPPSPPPELNYLLQEDGFNILLESGGKIELEAGN